MSKKSDAEQRYPVNTEITIKWNGHGKVTKDLANEGAKIVGHTKQGRILVQPNIYIGGNPISLLPQQVIMPKDNRRI